MPGLAARVPAHKAVGGDQERYSLEECSVFARERRCRVRLDAELGDHAAFVEDRNLELGPIGRPLALPGAEDERLAFDEGDADPLVVLEQVVEELDDRSEDLVGVTAAVDDS